MFPFLWELVYLCWLFLFLESNSSGVTRSICQGPASVDRSGFKFCLPNSMRQLKVLLKFSASLVSLPVGCLREKIYADFWSHFLCFPSLFSGFWPFKSSLPWWISVDFRLINCMLCSDFLVVLSGRSL